MLISISSVCAAFQVHELHCELGAKPYPQHVLITHRTLPTK